MRIVIDTNVWVSRLLLAGSPSARAVDKALEGHEVMVSEALMEELGMADLDRPDFRPTRTMVDVAQHGRAGRSGKACVS